MVADIEELQKMDASEVHARRLNAKEVLTPMNGENFTVPIEDGTVKLAGGDQVLRTSTLILESPDRGEEQGDLLVESDGSHQHHFKTHRCMMVKQEMISGPFQSTLLTIITLNQSQTVRAERRVIPNSIENIST